MGVLSGKSDYVRIVHLQHWEPERNRFNNFAFNRSSATKDPDRGVSLVSVHCVLGTDKSVCEHIRYYYPSTVVSDPPVFLPIVNDELPDCELKQKETESGDKCHYNLVGWSHGRCTKFLQTFWDKPEKLVICINGKERYLTLQDIDNWRAGTLVTQNDEISEQQISFLKNPFKWLKNLLS